MENLILTPDEIFSMFVMRTIGRIPEELTTSKDGYVEIKSNDFLLYFGKLIDELCQEAYGQELIKLALAAFIFERAEKGFESKKLIENQQKAFEKIKQLLSKTNDKK